MNKTEITLVSFGFRNGLPPQADMVFDMRGLINPFYVPALCEKTGLDQDVRDYVFSDRDSRALLRRLMGLLKLQLRLYEKKQRQHICIAIGCTGGHHRSVSMTFAVAERLRRRGYAVTVEHRDLEQ